MFSGIIEEFATVVAIKHDRENIDFTLTCSFTSELSIDQSVAHNGVCLTVVKIAHESGSAESGRQGECGAFDGDERPTGRTYRSGSCGPDG